MWTGYQGARGKSSCHQMGMLPSPWLPRTLGLHPPGQAASPIGGISPLLFHKKEIWVRDWLLLPLHHRLKARGGPAPAYPGSAVRARAPRCLLDRNILGDSHQIPEKCDPHPKEAARKYKEIPQTHPFHKQMMLSLVAIFN